MDDSKQCQALAASHGISAGGAQANSMVFYSPRDANKAVHNKHISRSSKKFTKTNRWHVHYLADSEPTKINEKADLERVVCAIEGQPMNGNIDVFRPTSIIEASVTAGI